MRVFVGLGVLGGLLATVVPVQAQQPDTEQAELLCEFTADCAAPANDRGTPETTAPAQGQPRSSATRGFTFTRATTSDAAPVARRAEGRPVDLHVSFAPGSADLTAEARARLGNVAAVLVSPRLSARRLRIEGHTDASGSASANLDLSRRRAQSVADYLIAAGVAKGRIDVVGYGSTRPLDHVDPHAAENRRVVAVLL